MAGGISLLLCVGVWVWVYVQVKIFCESAFESPVSALAFSVVSLMTVCRQEEKKDG